MRARLWYNPRCSTCRRVRAALEEAGHDVELVEYLKGGATRAEWAALADAVGGDPVRLLREREPLYKDLKLAEKAAAGKLGREQVIDLLHRHPRLLERPVVELRGRAVVARPPDRWNDLLGGG